MRINSILRFCFLFGILLHFSPLSHAQYNIEEFSLNDSVEVWYDKQIGHEQSGLVRGRYDKFEPKSKHTHPFYSGGYWNNGSLKYRNKIFSNTQLIYNIYEDVLTIQHPSDISYKTHPIAPLQNQVEWFTIGDKLFKYYPITLKKNTGFFEVLYEGDSIDILSKRKKILKVNDSGIRSGATFIQEDIYFVRVGEEYSVYKNKRSLIKLLKPYKKEIKNFVKSHNLKPRAKNEEDVKLLAKFCENLITKNS